MSDFHLYSSISKLLSWQIQGCPKLFQGMGFSEWLKKSIELFILNEVGGFENFRRQISPDSDLSGLIKIFI